MSGTWHWPRDMKVSVRPVWDMASTLMC
ncbi:hypothetical protein F383_35536 [Gossypium arboreum]|uniref:Uncharacterized protein n=1 Tax=Gossypium arboreum TaxID=29729 RepID=A0A0B0Q195_GOSAR|nr:hypothetical protein F383_35536 [Gossypium arboreum]